MKRRRFLMYAAFCAVTPAMACEQAGGAMSREEIAITVHKDPG
jgi:hypothetical protein